MPRKGSKNTASHDTAHCSWTDADDVILVCVLKSWHQSMQNREIWQVFLQQKCACYQRGHVATSILHKVCKKHASPSQAAHTCIQEMNKVLQAIIAQLRWMCVWVYLVLKSWLQLWGQQLHLQRWYHVGGLFGGFPWLTASNDVYGWFLGIALP